MPTIRMTYGNNVPVEATYRWSRQIGDYRLVEYNCYSEHEVIDFKKLEDHLDQLATEARPQWDLDAKRDAVERRHER